MLAALVIGVGVALVVLWLVARARRYAALFADPHLLEIGRGLGRVKAAALARVMRDERDAPTAADDPRVLATSAGLAIVYTVRERATRFEHHCSISVVGGPTPHAVGGTFVMLVTKLLGLTDAGLQCHVAASTVHHAALSVDAERHAALAALPIPRLTPAALMALRREALEARGSVSWQRTTRPADQAPG
jgi:hypothetical protein